MSKDLYPMKLVSVSRCIAAGLVSSLVSTGTGRADDMPPEFLTFTIGLTAQKVSAACDVQTTGKQRTALADKLASIRAQIPPQIAASLEQKVQAAAAECPETPSDKQDFAKVLSGLLEKSAKDFPAFMEAGSSTSSAAGAPASPEAGVLPKRVTADAFAAGLRDKGYKAEVVRAPEKTPFIRTGMNGRRISVYFLDCEGENCGSYQFRTYFEAKPKFDLALANTWNRDRRYTKAYLDKDNDLNLEWDVDLSARAGPGVIPSSIDSFASMAADFEKTLP